jgi:hypothetical protein
VAVNEDDENKLSRDPPTAVKHQLRQEVGWGCPMRDVGTDYCGSPYLTYHHFNPPWHKEHHHRPEDMVALCWTHHGQADALTPDQCRELKATALDRAGDVVGRFKWMRNNVLAIAGGNYYYETPQLVVYQNNPLIWFNRDDQHRLLLNIVTPDRHWNPRVSLVDNDWMVRGNPTDVESPPKGSKLRIEYPDGDRLFVRFREWADEDTLARWHPTVKGALPADEYPLTTAQIFLRLNGFGLDLTQDKTTIGGKNGATMTNCFMMNCGAGVVIR